MCIKTFSNACNAMAACDTDAIVFGNLSGEQFLVYEFPSEQLSRSISFRANGEAFELNGAFVCYCVPHRMYLWIQMYIKWLEILFAFRVNTKENQNGQDEVKVNFATKPFHLNRCSISHYLTLVSGSRFANRWPNFNLGHFKRSWNICANHSLHEHCNFQCD